jgi:hypothetical protein
LLQAINCRPQIESAAADVTVDYSTGAVEEFTVLEDPKPDLAPWSDPFVTCNQDFEYDPEIDDGYIAVDTSTRLMKSFRQYWFAR